MCFEIISQAQWVKLKGFKLESELFIHIYFCPDQCVGCCRRGAFERAQTGMQKSVKGSVA